MGPRTGLIVIFGSMLAAVAAFPAIAVADLAGPILTGQFAGYDVVVSEVGISGLRSSYYDLTKPVPPGSLNLIPQVMPALGPNRIQYPHTIGTVPSPGSYDQVEARYFDEGVLGVKVAGGKLVVTFAGGLDPLKGHYYKGWDTNFGQGDVFISVEDSSGVRQFALLNAWPRNGSGSPIRLDGGMFDTAQAFHTTGGTGNTSLEGYLIRLGDNDTVPDVVRVDGAGSYNPSYPLPPVGLDYRCFAQDGSVVGNAGLRNLDGTWAIQTVQDVGYYYTNDYKTKKQNWYVETWSVPFEWLSTDSVFDIALHVVPSCGNDQIGLTTQVQVPGPGAAILGLIGVGMVGWLKRRFC